MPNRIEIGKRLRDLRGQKPREAVAMAVGVTVQAICHYETGTRTPKDITKMKLANYYGKTVQEIFYD